jgi:hypothetical protein
MSILLRDTESTAFKPTLGTIPEGHVRYVVGDRRLRTVPETNIKCAATNVLVLDPSSLVLLCRMFEHRKPEQKFEKLRVHNIAPALEVVTQDDHQEIVIRACVDKSFVSKDEYGVKMIKDDISRLRRLPFNVLALLKDELLDEEDTPGELKKALKMIPEEAPDNELGAKFRVEFSKFDIAKGAPRLLSAVKLAPTLTEVRSKRKRVQEEMEMLSKRVTVEELKNGKLVFTFKSAQSIDYVNGTVIVTPAMEETDEVEETDA